MHDLLDQVTDAAASLSMVSLALFSGVPLQALADKLRGLWENFRTGLLSIRPPDARLLAIRGDAARGLVNQMSAGPALACGVEGFFEPRTPTPWLQPNGSIEATSYYESAALKGTLEASSALPPGFPAVEIEGEHYWDGGLVSNTPLQWVLENEPREDTLAFQVDLWSARGVFPGNMAEVTTRQKEIQYSSRNPRQV